MNIFNQIHKLITAKNFNQSQRFWLETVLSNYDSNFNSFSLVFANNNLNLSTVNDSIQNITIHKTVFANKLFFKSNLARCLGIVLWATTLKGDLYARW